MSSSTRSSDSQQLREEALFIATRHGSKLLYNLITSNPIELGLVSVEASVDLVQLARRAWRHANGQRVATRQSRDVGTVIGLVADRHLRAAAGYPVPALSAAPHQLAQPQPVPVTMDMKRVPVQAAAITRLPETDADLDNNWLHAVSVRAAEIARSPEAGTDFDNWLQAVAEWRIAQRAEQLAAEAGGGNDMDHWLRAEAELLIVDRARQIAASPHAGGDLDNWLAAEQEVLTRLRAREIALGPDAGGDLDNWLRAEREVLIARRAREIAASPDARGEMDNWLAAEADLLSRNLIRP